MRFLLALLPFLTLAAGGAPIPTFTSRVEDALASVRSGDRARAAAALDAAAAENAELFAANNLHYLSGRLAEDLGNWAKAQEQFAAVAPSNPLRPLAAWRAARIAMKQGNAAVMTARLTELPASFPSNLKLQIASDAPKDLALMVYHGLTGPPLREARLRQAILLKDTATLWKLLRERNWDDVALEAADFLAAATGDRLKPEDPFDLALTFTASRRFDDALRLFANAPPAKKTEAQVQIARVHFLKDDCNTALQAYQGIMKDYPKTTLAHDAEAQIANCYWRLNDFRSSEKAYVDFIAHYGGPAKEENALRNLVDVYRVLGENAKAIALIDSALQAPLTTATIQVLRFSKAKILFSDKKYAAATPLFHQLANVARIDLAPGATTKDEARYYEALSLLKNGDEAGSKALFKALTANPPTYYGQKAALRLGMPPIDRDPSFCSGADAVSSSAEAAIAALSRPIREGAATFGSAVSELVFLRLWDDASLATDLENRPEPHAAAQLAYLAGRYDRAIRYGSRLPKSDPLSRPMNYPAGYRALVCRAAQKVDADPQWLQAVIWQESMYDPLAKSGAAARGLMQFIPETANAVAGEAAIPLPSMDRLYDPETSINLGAHYWASLMAEFKSPELALAAYNGGPVNVRRWKMKWPGGDPEFVVSDIGFTETKAYVLGVFAARAAYAGVE